MISINKLAGGVALTALVCAMGTAVYAQETTGAIRGQVTGEDGQPVGGATVTIVHTPSGTRSVTMTNAQGVYDARGLRVGGPFQVTVVAPGLETQRLDDVQTRVGETLRLDFDVAAAVEELVVTGVSDPTANNNAVRTTLDAEQIESVVSVTRDIRDLARRSPLVSQNARGDGGISIAGSNPRNNRITIDGAQAQDDYGLNTGGTPIRRGPVSLDAVEQFTVDAVPIDVENGDFSGGALDVVLKSGGNDFHGSIFTNYLNDGMVGDSIRGGRVTSQVSQTNYGAFLSGPIWPDRVFFAASYELYESSDLTSTGPTGSGFANDITGVTQSTIDQITGIFDTNYATVYAPGAIFRTQPITDEKYSLKLDANITDRHRASLTYRYGLSEVSVRNGLSRTTATLNTDWYLTGEEDYSYVGELNSDWTDNLTTQLRVTYRDYERRQQPPLGQNFAEVQVCLAPTTIGTLFTTCDLPGSANPSQVRFGPDENRHANELETHNTQVQFKAEYTLGDHLFKAGYQYQENEIFNLFLPTQDGVYYFDSIADFAAGRASRLRYQDAVGGRTTREAAAALTYKLQSVFLQDTLEITPDLEVTAGVRFDWYKNDSPPPLNPNFLARNLFSNQTTYEGRSVLMPRIAFDWKPSEQLKITGGVGLFSGGVPDVLATNPYGGGVGFLSSGIDIQRTATGFTEVTGTPGFTPALGATALNLNLSDPSVFDTIPASVVAFQGGAVASPLSEVNAFSPAFRFPSDWKLFLSAQYDLESEHAWLDAWRLGVDVVGTKVRDSLYIRDLRAQPLLINGAQARLPDGRLRYDAVTATAAQRAAAGVTSANPGSSNRDLVFFNTQDGYTVTTAFWARRSFDFGLDVSAAYTWQEAKDVSSALRFSSTQSSNYQSPAGLDPNAPAYGPSYDVITHAFKFEADYRHNFFGDLESRVSLFAERRSGRRTSFTMGDVTTGRGPVFGVNRGNNHLLYVPVLTGETSSPTDLTAGLVTFADAATRDNFIKLVQQFGLPENTIVPKGYYENKWLSFLDLQLSQELPSPIRGHKFRFNVDIQNVLNLINDEWGIVEEYFDVNNVVQVACLDANGATPSAASPNGGLFACDRYRYQSFNTNALQQNIDTNGRSLWTIQVGLRYEF